MNQNSTKRDIIWLQEDAAACYLWADLYRDHINPHTGGHMAQLYPGHAEEQAVRVQEAGAYSSKLVRVAMGMPE